MTVAHKTIDPRTVQSYYINTGVRGLFHPKDAQRAKDVMEFAIRRMVLERANGTLDKESKRKVVEHAKQEIRIQTAFIRIYRVALLAMEDGYTKEGFYDSLYSAMNLLVEDAILEEKKTKVSRGIHAFPNQ